MNISVLRTSILAAITMCAFALNSVFGRIALSNDAIDPASYTSIRLASGALMLLLLVSLRGGFKSAKVEGSFFSNIGVSAIALFAYAAFFSFAYILLDTGVGALILFTCVQGVMIGWGIFTGERPNPQAWIGIVLAMVGFVYLVYPGLKAPDFWGATLMAISGIAWGGLFFARTHSAEPLAGNSAKLYLERAHNARLKRYLYLANKNGITWHHAGHYIGRGDISSRLCALV